MTLWLMWLNLFCESLAAGRPDKKWNLLLPWSSHVFFGLFFFVTLWNTFRSSHESWRMSLQWKGQWWDRDLGFHLSCHSSKIHCSSFCCFSTLCILHRYFTHSDAIFNFYFCVHVIHCSPWLLVSSKNTYERFHLCQSWHAVLTLYTSLYVLQYRTG